MGATKKREKKGGGGNPAGHHWDQNPPHRGPTKGTHGGGQGGPARGGRDGGHRNCVSKGWQKYWGGRGGGGPGGEKCRGRFLWQCLFVPKKNTETGLGEGGGKDLSTTNRGENFPPPARDKGERPGCPYWRPKKKRGRGGGPHGRGFWGAVFFFSPFTIEQPGGSTDPGTGFSLVGGGGGGTRGAR